MANQTGKGVLVALKAEATFNTAPGTSGGTQVRIKGGGLSMQKAAIQSEEIRSDGQTAIARHGSRSVTGSLDCEMSVGSHDDLYQGVMRSTWTTATTLTQASSTLTSLTPTATNCFEAGAGSFISAGVRVGDVFRITNHSVTANNNKNFRAKTVTATSLTVLGTGQVTTGATDTTFELTILKRLKRPATPTKRTYYIEHYYQDIDLSEVFGGCRLTSMRITGTPDGMAEVSFGAMGVSVTALTTGTSPYYISPTLATSKPLVFADATISYNGADLVVGTGFQLDYQIAAKTEPVIGSPTSPDVFDNDVRITGSLSFIRQDLANLSAFINETEVELHILLTENESEPKDCLGIYLPLVKLMSVDRPLGGDGAMIETVNFTAGIKEGFSATGYDDQMMALYSSAA